MGKLIHFMMTSLDGYFEGSKPWSLEWHNVDGEFNDFAIGQLREADTLLFGRKTYEGMAAYWPGPAAVQDDPVVAGLMNGLPKVVFSKSLPTADWANTRLVREDAVGETARLKAQTGKAIFLLGSSDLAVSLTDKGLIDEYRVMVNPVLLGSGRPQFQGLKEKHKLKLVETRRFHSGNMLLIYHLR